MDIDEEPIDITPEDLEEHAAKTYPIGPDDHIGVSTSEGTPAVAMDQGDEQNDAPMYGTPDGPDLADSGFPTRQDS